MNSTIIAGGIFILVYILIVSERMHRTLAALLGGLAMIIFNIISQEEAFQAIDWNVIFLLIGMMVIAGSLRESGFFQWLAVHAVRLGKGNPFWIMVILSLITAFTSALLDNVTIVVLMAPVTFFVAATLRMSPIPFLIAGILASNIGGTATLIGDPPNILIGSAAGIDFLTFAENMAPISLIILITFIGLSRFLFRKDLHPGATNYQDVEALDTSSLITNRSLLIKGLIVMAFVLLGFFLQAVLHFEPATIALIGAIVLLIWSRNDPHHALREVEWVTLFFFIGLFIAVEAVVKVGIIESIAQGILRLTGSNIQVTSISLLWFSALASSIVDNIPYTTTIIPLVESLGHVMPSGPLWWSLALGACLGGNATLVGAAANVVVADLANRSGHPISFRKYLNYSLLTTLMSLILASIYVWLRYLT